MADNILVMPGPARADLRKLHEAAADFGYSVEVVRNLREASAAVALRHTVAILFHRAALAPDCSWREAIRGIHAALPDARLIACHGFAEALDWEELSEAGAFHSLVLPLKDSEVRQSLGFIRQAEARIDGAPRTESEPVATHKLLTVPRPSAERQRKAYPGMVSRAAS